jgi:ATP-dependent RNA helicase RhlB
MMFTATLSQRVMTLGWRQMNDPVEVIVSAEQLTPDTVHQVLYHVATREKLSLLLGVLEREGSSRTMIFVNTRFRAQRLVDDLRRHGYSARGLTGNVVQTKRLRVLDEFDYVHRIGRTARVGAEGKAITLACEDYVYSLDAIQRYVGYELPSEFADDGLFAEVRPRDRRPHRTDARRPRSSQPRTGQNQGGDAGTKPRRRRRRRPRRKPGGNGGGKGESSS